MALSISTFTNIVTLDVASVIVSLYDHNQGWYAGRAVLHLYDPRSIKFGWMQSQHFRREPHWICVRLQHSPELEASTASAVEALWSCDTFNLLLGRTRWSHCVCIVKVNWLVDTIWNIPEPQPELVITDCWQTIVISWIALWFEFVGKIS